MSTTTAYVPPVSQGPSTEELKLTRRASRRYGLFAPHLLRAALKQSLVMLRPDIQWKNPVMFMVEVGAVLTVLFTIAAVLGFSSQVPITYLIALDVWLLLTVLFANFATALAEARGKAQADSLRKTRRETPAFRLLEDGQIVETTSTALQRGDRVIVEAGQVIPGDGEIVEGVASVDESAITGESAPVIREAGGDRSAVTGGTRVLSDQIKVKLTSNPGDSFVDRMIALVEGAEREEAPNDIARSVLLAGLTLVFLLAVVTLQPFAMYSVKAAGAGTAPTVTVLISLLVCLIPTTIGGLLSAIGIAGMDRVMQHNVLAMSGKAVEAAGDVNTLLLDKTGTITLGNRQATQFHATSSVKIEEFAQIAQLASLADETPEGRSIVVLAKETYGIRGREVSEHEAHFIPFSAYSRMSGVDVDGRQLRKGATDAIVTFVKQKGGNIVQGFVESS